MCGVWIRQTNAVGEASPRPTAGWVAGRLFREPIEDIDQFVQPLATFVLALGDAVGHATLDVMPEDAQADAIQRCFRSRELLEDLDTEPWLLDHAANAADLTLDPIEPRD